MIGHYRVRANIVFGLPRKSMPLLRWTVCLLVVSIMLYQHHSIVRAAFALHTKHTAFRGFQAKHALISGSEFEKTTIAWVKRVVIGLKLCPFAKRPLRERILYTRLVEETDESVVVDILQKEMEQRLDYPGTTLVILPKAKDFYAFWEFVQKVEKEIIAVNDWQGRLQVVPFHPQFVFQGSESTDADNYTNRSPFPMIHILREDDVTEAVATLPDGNAGTIWSRNVEFLRTLSDELDENEFQSFLSGQPLRQTPKLGQKLRDILRRYPGTLKGRNVGNR